MGIIRTLVPRTKGVCVDVEAIIGELHEMSRAYIKDQKRSIERFNNNLDAHLYLLPQHFNSTSGSLNPSFANEDGLLECL